MFNSLQFWVLIAGLLAFIAKYNFPGLPISEAMILSAVLFLLGLIGVYPTALARRSLGVPAIFKSLAFWVMVSGLGAFVLSFYVPDFPFDQAAILALILFILRQFGIDPAILEQAAIFGVRAAEQAGSDQDIYKKGYAMGAARDFLGNLGYKRVHTDLLDAYVEQAVYDQFNDPVVYSLQELMD
jgi:hypothetical protein